MPSPWCVGDLPELSNDGSIKARLEPTLARSLQKQPGGKGDSLMCGIVGIVPREPAEPGRLDALVRRMAAAIKHRGPDDEGFFVNSHVALGVRRLSILDLNNGGQPMLTADRTKAIVFNGEIYNHQDVRRELATSGHQFKTHCDTETVLHAFDRWGKDGLTRLEGMFGLAVWDERRRVLTLARDWLGQKSLYFTETPKGWAFASEIKALLVLDGVKRELDLQSLSHYLSTRHLPGTSTFFKGISKLPPALWAEVAADSRLFRRYWMPAYAPKWTGSEEEVLDGLDTVMKKVVGEHLMSDVPLGAFLSGGIDSSLIVAYAALASPEPLRTFSIGVNDQSQSELPWARVVAERYRTQHFERIVEPDLAALAPLMVSFMEEPVDPFAAGVFVASHVAAGQVKVCLAGDGGDELFAGYDRYAGQMLAERYSQIPAPVRRHFLRPLLRLIPERFGYKSLATKLRWLDRMAELKGVDRYAESAGFLRFPHALKARLFEDDIWKKLEPQQSEQIVRELFSDGCAAEFIDQMLHADCMTRLSEHSLPIVDRMSMAHSLEVRCPFLDRRVADYAMRIPAAWKLRRGRIKYVPRTLARRYLPKALVDRKKQGFGFPLALWFRDGLRPLIENTVETSHLARDGVFRREEMERLVREHVAGNIDHNYRLWLLFTMELFYRYWIESHGLDELNEWVEESRRPSGGFQVGLPDSAQQILPAL
jgi:asparagine synthase (glutamine-hydrolysing)